MDKYKLELRHRARPGEVFSERHEAFLKEISRLGFPWNLVGSGPLPDIGSELIVSLSLDKVLGSGIKGRITYVYRGLSCIEDSAQYDDSIFIEFYGDKVSSSDLIKILPVYIQAFDCYRATIHNWSITRSDWPKVVDACNGTGKDVNGRDGVYRINAINYFDRELCHRAFGLSPEQIVKRLDGKVESVSLLNDGVFIIYCSRPMSREEHENINAEVRALLG